MELILASTSPYRRQLLKRLQLPFRCVAPKTDETPRLNESGPSLAARLARAKAESVAEVNPEAIVVGSDQVAMLDARFLGKPGNYATATAQLQASSGREVTFYTGIALVCHAEAFAQVHVEPFTVRLRTLRQEQIKNYLHREQPYDCAGSFKVEGLGIALFETLRGNDPSALEGLPLITLCQMLTAIGIDIFTGI